MEADHLPSISDPEAAAKAEKTKHKQEQLAQELAAIKAMTLEQKLALLKKYVPQEHYKLNHFIDACDSTDAFCFARIMQISQAQGNLQVNFDGWSNKWDLVSRICSDFCSGTDLSRARLHRSALSTSATPARPRRLFATT